MAFLNPETALGIKASGLPKGTLLPAKRGTDVPRCRASPCRNTWFLVQARRDALLRAG